MSKITPITVKISSSHQADRPMSCRRRAPTAKLGSKVAMLKTVESGSIQKSQPKRAASRMLKQMLAITKNRVKYQYSLLLARPPKVTYLVKHVLIAVGKFMMFFPLSRT